MLIHRTRRRVVANRVFSGGLGSLVFRRPQNDESPGIPGLSLWAEMVEAAGIPSPIWQAPGIAGKPFDINWLHLLTRCAETQGNARKRTAMLPGCCLGQPLDIARLERITRVMSLLRLDDEDMKGKLREGDDLEVEDWSVRRALREVV